MTEKTNAQPQAAPALDPATTVGTVTLGVADLEKMTQFYHQLIGLTILDRTDQTAALGIDAVPLVKLESRPTGKRYPRATGLFHLAILLPTRQDLGHWLSHLAANRYPLSGAGDHLVSEALYLSDPEGNGIEMYRDRPRDTWEYSPDGTVKMDTLAVDLPALVADAPDTAFTGLPAGTRMGHVHLQVNDVNQAVNFYRDILGFDLIATWSGAGFVSAGRYHHHLGLNIWNSRGAAPPPPGSLGLLHYQIVLPTELMRDTLLAHLEALAYPMEQTDADPLVRDPAGNGIELVVRS
ncbi:MAG: VOC family protein [Anaerolineaceae bacterium]|nr:VOC family protein [Anaerolineaceae bacterium]